MFFTAIGIRRYIARTMMPVIQRKTMKTARLLRISKRNSREVTSGLSRNAVRIEKIKSTTTSGKNDAIQKHPITNARRVSVLNIGLGV